MRRSALLPSGSLGSVAVLSVALAGCACGAPPSTPGGAAARSPVTAIADDHIVNVHHAKCGACHLPVEPGTRTRLHLETALQRHRARAKLSDRDWAELVDYLASDGAAVGDPWKAPKGAKHSARNP